MYVSVMPMCRLVWIPGNYHASCLSYLQKIMKDYANKKQSFHSMTKKKCLPNIKYQPSDIPMPWYKQRVMIRLCRPLRHQPNMENIDISFHLIDFSPRAFQGISSCMAYTLHDQGHLGIAQQNIYIVQLVLCGKCHFHLICSYYKYTCVV